MIISNKLLKLASLFYALASDSKDLSSILSQIENTETYTDRKELAEKNLQHLSSGSSRIVYLTPDNTIIKLAKNDKGIAQNKAESNPKMKSKYLNIILNKAENDSWIEVFFLEKITEKQFEEMTSIKFKDFGEAIRYGLKDVSQNKDIKKPDNFDQIKKSDIYQEVQQIGEKFKLMPGDLARISSWGTKNNKQPVLIDAGLTSSVYDKFYDSSS